MEKDHCRQRRKQVSWLQRVLQGMKEHQGGWSGWSGRGRQDSSGASDQRGVRDQLMMGLQTAGRTGGFILNKMKSRRRVVTKCAEKDR